MTLAIDHARLLLAPYTRRALPVGAANMGIPMIWTDVTSSTTIVSPGGYVGKTAGITLRLAASARGGPVAVKALAVPINVVDAAGAVFDASASSFVLAILDEQVTLNWSAADTSWLVGG